MTVAVMVVKIGYMVAEDKEEREGRGEEEEAVRTG